MRVRRLGLSVSVFLAVSSGCAVVVQGSKLSDRPDDGHGIYLTTGGSPRPFRTLGFAQIRGYGVQIAGVADVGDANLDSTLKGTLAYEASRMGGDAVINIEFIDENPSTPADRMNAANSTVAQMGKGSGGADQQDRYVTVSGEVIKFL